MPQTTRPMLPLSAALWQSVSERGASVLVPGVRASAPLRTRTEAAVLLRSLFARPAVCLWSPDQTNSREHERTQSREAQRFGDVRPFSLAFAVL